MGSYKCTACGKTRSSVISSYMADPKVCPGCRLDLATRGGD